MNGIVRIKIITDSGVTRVIPDRPRCGPTESVFPVRGYPHVFTSGRAEIQFPVDFH